LVSPFFSFALFAVLVLIALRLRLPDDDPQYAGRGEVMAAPFSASSNPQGSGSREPAEIHEEDRVAVDAYGAEAVSEEPQRLHWRDARMRPWLVTGLLGGHAQAMVLGIIGFLLLDRLGLRSNPDAGAGPIGLVLMLGAVATLLAQWGLIPMMHLGPRGAALWGMALAAVGTLVIAFGSDLHATAIGFAVASLGFGLYRPGFTAGASLAVSRAEQGQSAGIVAAVNGAAYIVAPAIGVWLYNHSPWVAWSVILTLCGSVLLLGWKGMKNVRVLEG
jgi:hypothetical protein